MIQSNNVLAKTALAPYKTVILLTKQMPPDQQLQYSTGEEKHSVN